ncbi:LysE family translocator [Nakamurella sp. YIM 132087]|uniref:LysE family translocator n=1 Tax=Nakamurella alba TaxID=2665158 RepID=A0A7K1FRQ9_9ACTN|nr:LysE family translocator [Nakamurella alba]MTD16826.1 LysE family translocator [Nakamurella alba]
MTLLDAVLSFAVVAGLLTITPGLDTALVLRSALTQGRAPAFATALGVGTGALIWGAAAAVGVSALLTAWTVAFTILKIVGAAYMLFLGGRLLWAAVRGTADPAPVDAGPVARSAWTGWRRGMLTNLLNPKVGAFYVAVLPQFLPPDVPHLWMGLLLAFVHTVLGMIWFTGVILGASSVRRWLTRRSAQRTIDGGTGAVLVGFGVKLALTR